MRPAACFLLSIETGACLLHRLVPSVTSSQSPWLLDCDVFETVTGWAVVTLC